MRKMLTNDDANAPVAPLAAAAHAVLLREIRGLSRELDAYSSDTAVWALAPTISNSAGTLVLHISGNLQHFVGSVLGGGDYVRDRDAEFSRRDVPRPELQRELRAAADAVDAIIPRLTSAQLDAPFPVAIAGRRVRTSDFLAHLIAHVSYHLGQVDFHRRLLDGGSPVDVVAPAELPGFAE